MFPLNCMQLLAYLAHLSRLQAPFVSPFCSNFPFHEFQPTDEVKSNLLQTQSTYNNLLFGVSKVKQDAECNSTVQEKTATESEANLVVAKKQEEEDKVEQHPKRLNPKKNLKQDLNSQFQSQVRNLKTPKKFTCARDGCGWVFNFKSQLNQHLFVAHKQRKPRTPFTQTQLVTLESAFIQSAKPKSPNMIKLAEEIGLTKRQVRAWFQYRRAKQRKADQLLGAANMTTPKSPKTRLSIEQREELVRIFEQNPFVDTKKCFQLAHQFGKTPSQIRCWFKNQRSCLRESPEMFDLNLAQ